MFQKNDALQNVDSEVLYPHRARPAFRWGTEDGDQTLCIGQLPIGAVHRWTDVSASRVGKGDTPWRALTYSGDHDTWHGTEAEARAALEQHVTEQLGLSPSPARRTSISKAENDRWKAERDREAAGAVPEPALRPMSEAPRDGTWVLLGGCQFGYRWRVARWSEWSERHGFCWNDLEAYGFEPAGWLPLPSGDGWRATHRHYNGGEIRVIKDNVCIEATMQVAVIYEAQDGTWWVRPHAEFFDGRFTLIGEDDQ